MGSWEALLFPQVELLRATDCVRHTELVQEDCRGARPVGHTEPATMSDALLDMCGVDAKEEAGGATDGGEQPPIRSLGAINRRIEMLEPEPETALDDPAATAGRSGLPNDLDQMPEIFTFNHVADHKSPFEDDFELKELLDKWGMSELMQVHCFRFDQYYKKYMSDKLLLDFVRDPNVQSVFKVPLKGKGSVAKGPQSLGDVTKIRTEAVPTTLTSFDVFDRLGEDGVQVVRGESGHIAKCFDNYIDELQIADKLRELLVDEDSENYTVFSDAERDELLLRIFRHCVLGGGMCQYEDMVQPYFEVSKKLYKGLLAVRKHEETGKIEILTEVFSLKSVRASDRGAPSLFPGRSPYRPQLLSLCFFPSVPLCLVVSVSLPLCFCLFVFVFLSAFSVMFQLEVSLHSTFWRQETGDSDHDHRRFDSEYWLLNAACCCVLRHANRYSFCYLFVNPVKRTVLLWYRRVLARQSYSIPLVGLDASSRSNNATALALCFTPRRCTV